ncbi:MAG: protein phosphatase 2C domain-containing protein, partial [Oscillospiraceae bacterium]|nr:protein phosphatase 2C domain-containing protein [Oscillospiraceae bacterium]
MNEKSYGITNRGKVRAENQDSFVIEYIESRECLAAVVCDGMGGENAGSIASTLASKIFISYFVDRIMASRAKNPDMKRHMLNACRKANDIVYSYSCFSANYSGMGTT